MKLLDVVRRVVETELFGAMAGGLMALMLIVLIAQMMRALSQ